MEEFPNLVQVVGPRLVSDHFPVILESCLVSLGPTPFRFENMWASHHDCKRRVREWWTESEVEGWHGRKANTLREIAEIDKLDCNDVLSNDLVLKSEGLRNCYDL